MNFRSALTVPALVAALAAAGGCGGDPKDSGVACDESAVASVQVVVTASDDTSNFLDATVTYAHEGGETGTCENLEGTTLVCGWDLTGELVLTATADGYVPGTKTVNVESDGCHAITTNETLRLDPA